MNTIALLAGINEYPFKPLRGCINDVNSVEKFLIDFYEPEHLKIKKLLNANATRQGLIDAFQWFEQAQDGDHCLFYYSGHGSYMTAAQEFWTETDGNLETLVCYDSRLQNGRDLTNKELGFLIWQYTHKKKINFVVITDSCHSGSVTRDMFDEKVWLSDRTAPTKTGTIPVEDFYGFNLDWNGERGYLDNLESGIRKVSIRVADHIHLAASRNNQTAKEDEILGEHRGVFTYSLLRTLISNNTKISYQNLIASTSAKVKTLVADQDPSLNIIGLEDLTRLRMFLGTQQIKDGERVYKVFFDKNAGWTINGGGINDFKTGDKVKLSAAGEALINEVRIDTASLIGTAALDSKKEYDALVTKSKRISVSFAWNEWENDWKTAENIKQKAQEATDFYIPEAGDGMFFIRCREEKYFLSPKNSEWALFKKIEIADPNAIDELVSNIDKVCRWYLLKELENPGSGINEENVKIKVQEVGGEESTLIDDGYFFYYKVIDSKWKAPKLKISLEKANSLGKVEVKPIYLGFDYSVDVSAFNSFQLSDQPQDITITSEGKTENELTLFLNKKYQELGYNQITEYLKLFVSTKQLETDGFAQEGIELEQNKKDQDRSAESRGLSTDPDEEADVEDWQVFTIKLTITRPSEAAVLPGNEFRAFGLTFINPGQLKAQMGFSTTDEITQRGFKGVETTIPLHELKGNDILKPAELLANHGQGQSLNVIELFNTVNPESVNETTPLVIKQAKAQSTDETIIPFGYDPETRSYFPLGGTDQEGKIVINLLPPETASDALITQRSFIGSIKIYFYKIIGQKIGLKYQYPQLAMANVDEREKLTYEKDPERIKKEVEKSTKILLFIHGIIGDTEEMTKAVRRARTPKGKLLVEEFDLILTFDYENLNTKIQQTAADLKQRLSEVGLSENHGKELVIVAHSMGGLVSRYFIEKLGGNKAVSHLIMLGTPNGGSEWADVRDLAEVLLTTAVNGAAFLKPWLIPLSFMGKLLAGAQITLQQMNDKGELSILSELNDKTNSNVKYTILAGNTQLIGGFVNVEDGILKRIVKRLKEKPAYATLDLLVFKEANDIAVRVKNIGTIAGLTPDVHEVASDHISYFAEPLSLEKLGSLL